MAERMTPIRIASMINTDELGSALHDAALNGEKRRMKKILKSGIAVDYPNGDGQTALLCACFEGHEAVVDLLLKHGANPNERCSDGSTPVHASGYSCRPKILTKLIEAGGDLRLHDNRGRNIKDCMMCQKDGKRRHKMMEYLEKTRNVAITESSRDVLLEKQPSNYYSMKKEGTTSFVNLFKAKSSHKSLSMSSSVLNHGFGTIYCGDREHIGEMATIPLVCETAIRHDEYGYTFNDGPFMVMESMLWHKVPVTVKRLHREPKEGGNVDLLIKENEYMARLRHPNILLMMAVCQTNNLDGLLLLYERVGCGSLYSYLYQKVETLDTLTMCEIMKQISEAVLYLHQENLLHCAITSHAVQLVLPNFAKLGNFEYMVDGNPVDGTLPRSNVVSNKYLNAVYNWLAPEMLAGKPPSKKSDLYSLCAVLWEVLHGMPPWCGMHAMEIHTEVVDNRNMLEIKEAIKNPFSALLQYGLAVEPKGRQISVEQFRNILGQVLVDHDTMGIKGDTPHPQRAAKTFKHVKKPRSMSVSSADEETLDLKVKHKKKTPIKHSPATKKSSDSDGRDNKVSSESSFSEAVHILDKSFETKKEDNFMLSKATSPIVRTSNVTTSPRISKTTKSPQQKAALDHTDSIKIPDVKNNSSSCVPDVPEDPDSAHKKARTAFFGYTSLAEPQSTSTPTTMSPAVIKAPTGMTDSAAGKDENTQSEEKSKNLLSPQNPFKREYKRLQSEDIKATITEVLTAHPPTHIPMHENKYTSTRSYSTSILPISKTHSYAQQPQVTLRKTTSTVYGALLGEHVTKAARPNPVLRENYFIAKDFQVPPADEEVYRAPIINESPDESGILKPTAAPVMFMGKPIPSRPKTIPILGISGVRDPGMDEISRRAIPLPVSRTPVVSHPPVMSYTPDDIISNKAGPVYLTARPSIIHTLPVGSRHSLVDPTHPGRVSCTTLNTFGSRHSWAVPTNKDENPGCFKPASHRQGFTTSPGRTNPMYAGAPMAHAIPPESEPTYTGNGIHHSPVDTRRMPQYNQHHNHAKYTRFADEPDGEGILRPDHCQPMQSTPMKSMQPDGLYYTHYDPTPPGSDIPEKRSPREYIEEWYHGDTGGIKNLISNYQDHTDQHFQKQAVLVKNHKTLDDPKVRQRQLRTEMQLHIDHQKQEARSPKPGAVTVDRVESIICGVDERQSCFRPSQIAKKAMNVSKSMEVTPLGMKHIGADIYPPTTSFRSEVESMHLSACPSHTHHHHEPKVRQSEESGTDQEVYEAIDTAMEKAHSDLLIKMCHPECPHKADSISRARGQSRHNLNNNCHSEHFEMRPSCPAFNSAKHATGDKLDQSKDGDLTVVSEMGTSGNANDIEDIYFDDVLNGDLIKEKYMRLQNTLPLDSTSLSASDSMHSPVPSNGIGPLVFNESNLSQRKARRDKKMRSQQKQYDCSKMNGDGQRNPYEGQQKGLTKTTTPTNTSRGSCKTFTSIMLDDDELLV